MRTQTKGLGCKPCADACNYNAIIKENKTVSFNKEEWMSCGECVDAFKLTAMRFGNNKDLDFMVSFYEPKDRK
ncbi:MAG: hypothetical protein H7Y13_14735 [Sphingobacteriaceae bacterium]|nr:hypothetical protein [Sphingobacteriaceae bacterium]